MNRHEAASRFFEKGLNSLKVTSITGHEDFRMLSRCTHIKPKSLVNRFNFGVLWKKKTNPSLFPLFPHADGTQVALVGEFDDKGYTGSVAVSLIALQ